MTGPRAGDELYVSGQLGGSAVGLAWLQQATAEQRATDEQAACRQRYLKPEPRVALGRLLGRNRATRTCVDLSDGLADAIRQLASASRVGAVVEADALPIQADARAWFEGQGIDPVVASLAAGEDYELIFTVPSSARRRLRAVSKLLKDLRLTRSRPDDEGVSAGAGTERQGGTAAGGVRALHVGPTRHVVASRAASPRATAAEGGSEAVS